MTEFELIQRYFDRPAPHARLGIGDDCALLAPRAGHELAISTDMLVAGRHFFADVDPAALGWKALAVNLSDLAAMGAAPLAFTLALALPDADPEWIGPFADGLFACADRYGCELIGGDTTRGPLTVCITIFGEVVAGLALRRSGARIGDDIWVAGVVGDAGYAVATLRTARDVHGVDAAIAPSLRAALERPEPMIGLGQALRGIASAAIDVSDGLTQDLGHVLSASRVGATLWPDRVPVSELLAVQGDSVRYRCALAGGDDYVLCFTAAADRRGEVEAAGLAHATRVTRIGVVEAEPGLRTTHPDGAAFVFAEGLRLDGFDHFA